MKKSFLFLLVVILYLTISTASNAALYFKMTTDKTQIAIDETATITLSAKCEEAIDLNGLNNWQLGLTVAGLGSVEVLEGTITLFAPFAYDTAIMYDNVNNPLGSIEDLQLNPISPPEDSVLGVGDYDQIAQFMIRGVSEGDVTYTIGNFDGDFFGLLRDYDFMTGEGKYDGIFDMAASTYQLTVVPEPASFLLFGGVSLFLLRRRNRNKI